METMARAREEGSLTLSRRACPPHTLIYELTQASGETASWGNGAGGPLQTRERKPSKQVTWPRKKLNS